LANDAKSQGFGAIRIVGFDCNALDLASSAAAAAGIQVMAGIYVSVSIVAFDTRAFLDANLRALQGSIAAGAGQIE